MNEIINFINCYLKLKDDYKEYNKENLYDVFTIFSNEVFELGDIVSALDFKINTLINEDILLNNPIYPTAIVMEDYEGYLLNEIADVLLTTARLIKEFKLEEPLTEMMEYKYHRQLVREENNKNE